MLTSRLQSTVFSESLNITIRPRVECSLWFLFVDLHLLVVHSQTPEDGKLKFDKLPDAEEMSK